MRLRRRPRFDTLQNEIRARGRSWGRWIYLGLLGLFAIWALNLFMGDLVYFRAEGMVMRDRVVLATQYPASVEQLNVQEGSEIEKGQLLARVRSQSVEESLAKLYGGLVDGLSQTTQLEVRDRVIRATALMAEQRSVEARQALDESNKLRDKHLLTIGRRAELVKDEIDSTQARTQAAAEGEAITKNLPQLEAALASARMAIARLRETYADGVVRAPVNGVVGSLPVSTGSVVQSGEPLMEIYSGKPYVLAYVPSGALYDLQPGDPVNIGVGFSTYSGHLTRLYPVAQQLPKEFQNTFQPVARARLARIDFDSDGGFPALFTKTTLSAAGWPPAWMVRLGRSVAAPVERMLPEPVATRPRGSEPKSPQPSDKPENVPTSRNGADADAAATTGTGR